MKIVITEEQLKLLTESDLDIMDFVSDKLTSLFGDLWIPVFKEWFEKNSKLEVHEMKINVEIIRL